MGRAARLTERFGSGDAMKKNGRLEVKYYCIRRVDVEDNRTHGWVVQIQRKRQTWRKTFTDGKLGGSANALRVAIEYRDRVLAKYPGYDTLGICQIKRRSNRSGMPGVARIKDVDAKGKTTFYWLAFCNAGGKRRARKFSVARYGERRAKRLALAARTAFVEEHAQASHQRTNWQLMYESGEIK